jgi:hypothetical protein
MHPLRCALVMLWLSSRASVEVPQPTQQQGFAALSRFLPGAAAASAPRFELGWERPPAAGTSHAGSTTEIADTIYYPDDFVWNCRAACTCFSGLRLFVCHGACTCFSGLRLFVCHGACTCFSGLRLLVCHGACTCFSGLRLLVCHGACASSQWFAVALCDGACAIFQ